MELEIETAASKQDAPAGKGGVKTEPDVAAIRDAIIEKLTYALGKRVVTARPARLVHATALTVRDRIVERWIASNDETQRTRRKRVYYLSLEFLIGRLLIDALTNMEMIEQTRAALAELGVDLEELRELNRMRHSAMAASAGSPPVHGEHGDLSIAAYGYGIRYDQACFGSESRTGVSSNIRKTGCRLAILGGFRGRNSNMRSFLAAA